MKLLRKMVPTALPFHLTLLSVCFSNLRALPTAKGSIGFYLQGKGPAPAAGQGGRGKVLLWGAYGCYGGWGCWE